MQPGTSKWNTNMGCGRAAALVDEHVGWLPAECCRQSSWSVVKGTVLDACVRAQGSPFKQLPWHSLTCISWLHTQFRLPGTNYARASASCNLHLSNINSRHFFWHSVITLQTDCVNWLFTTDFSLINNVKHLCSWPHCNRHTINSFMMMMMMINCLKDLAIFTR